jgi:hypothetical protein
MTRSEAGKLGALVSSPRLREQAIKRYYEDPSICEECGKIIGVREGERPSEAKRKKFCDHTCSAKQSNRNRARPRVSKCKRCGKPVHSPSRYVRLYCEECYPIQHLEKRRTIHLLTKKELRDRCKSHPNFKVLITGDAYKVYKRSGKPMVCRYCSYDLHVEICHIQDVKDFPDDALIGEINHPDNLIALCRNHHWEFDHGHITFKPA